MPIYFYEDSVPEPSYHGPECYRELYMEHYNMGIIWFHELSAKQRHSLLRGQCENTIGSYIRFMCNYENIWDVSTKQEVDFFKAGESGLGNDYHIRELFRTADDLAEHPKDKERRKKFEECVAFFDLRKNKIANYHAWETDQKNTRKQRWE